MRKLSATLLVGATALLATGAVAADAVAANRAKQMEVPLPDGGVAHIAYAGDVAPRVVVTPIDAPAVAAAYDPFAEMAAISAMMDRQADAMMRRMAAMQRAAAAPVDEAGAEPHMVVSGNLPAGSVVSYSYVATSDANGTCVKSVEWRSDGSGAKPRMISNSAGDCAGRKKDGLGARTMPVAAAETARPSPAARAPLDPRRTI